MKIIPYIIIALMLTGLALATPLSITDSNYITFDSGLAGPAWQVIVRGDNSADYVLFAPAAQITGTKDNVAVQAKSNFQLSTSIEQELCRYSLSDTAARTDIYKYNIVKEANNQWVGNNAQTLKDCSLKLGYLYGWVYTQTFTTASLFRDVYCLYQTPLANAGDVGDGQLNFKAKFTLQQTGSPDIIDEINTLASTQGDISSTVNLMQDNNKVAIIKWIGGSTFGEMCPAKDQYVAIQYLNNWQTSNKDRYNEYDTQNKALTDHIAFVKNQQTVNYATSGETQKLQELVTSVNNRATDVLIPEAISTGTNTATIDQSTSILTLPRDHLIYAPDFQIFLSTDYLKLVYLTGRPKITDAVFTTCEEGNNADAIKVTVQNIGNTKGQFIADIVCDAGITLGTTTRSITLDPDQTGTITLPFSVNLASDSSKSCAIVVSDSLVLENKDSTSISMNCKASTVCSPEGTTRCIPGDNNEYKCLAGQWAITGTKNCANSTCNRNNKCEANLGESFELCGGKTSYNNDCATCNHDKHCDATETIFSCPTDCTTTPPITNPPTWLYILGGVIAALAIFFLSEKLGKKKHKKKKRR